MVVIVEEDKSQMGPSSPSSVVGEHPPPYSAANHNAPITVEYAQTTYDRDLPGIPGQSGFSVPASRPVKSRSPPSGLQPCNFLHISRNHSAIRGQFILDPSLNVPEGVLPPIKKRHIRKNLNLESDHAPMDVEVWVVNGVNKNAIVPPSETAKPRRKPATIRMKGNHASATVKIHSYENIPTQLWVRKDHSNANIYIPRTFTGPLTFKTDHGSLHLSPAVNALTTTFSDYKGTRTAFIGDLASSGWEGQSDPHAWDGDALVLKFNHGRASVFFIDEEPEPKPVNPASPFLQKLLGRRPSTQQTS